MLRNQVKAFINDQDGGYTVWGLFWFILFVGIGGLAVDVTDAYRTQSTLQATADAAALAGIIEALNDETAVDAQALKYAAFNMRKNVHGTVLTATDVKIGTWNFTARTFTEGTANPNAVYATTRRATTNENPLATNFLRIAGLTYWDVAAEAVAAKGVNLCRNNGIIAGRYFDVKTHIHFLNNICLIGHEQFWFRDKDTYFDDGVYIGAGCAEDDKKCIGPGNQVNKNEDFIDAFGLDGGDGNYLDSTAPVNAQNVGTYIEAVKKLPTFTSFDLFVEANNTGSVDYSGYKYLTNNGLQMFSYTGSALPAPVNPGVAAEPYTVYYLDTCDKSGYTMPSGKYDHVAIIADCPLKFGTSNTYDIKNSLIASTFTGNTHAIDMTGHVDIGTPGDCADGGPVDGSEFYSLGDLHFAAGGNFADVRFLVDGDLEFAASPQGPVGIDVEATGDFFTASGAAAGSEMGLCPGSPPVGAQSLDFALVQ